MVRSRSAHVVLLSGGVDSAVILAMLCERGAPTEALWIAYGQAATEAEEKASRAIATHYDVPWSQRRLIGGPAFTAGEIPARNDFLIATASLGRNSGIVTIGIHAGTCYLDNSPAWLDAWEMLSDTQHGGSLFVAAPLINLKKPQVYDMAMSLKVPIELTHSCEADNSPCRSCRSCLDREMLVVRA